MEKLMYMMMIEKSKSLVIAQVTKKIIIEHVENIRRLIYDEGKLEICGV